MTTALDAIKAAYPAQYYGDYSAGYLTRSTLIDVWNGVTQDKQSVNLLSLPAASDLLTLTSDQWTLSNVAGVTGHFYVPVSAEALAYPQRFYCDKNAPCAVYDMWGFSSAPTEPALTDLYSITAAAYTDRQANPRQQYYDTATGALADYAAPVPVITLAQQATTVLATARTTVYNNYGILNEATPDTWVAYLKALMAIANGSDATSTELPSQPAETVAS
ncbi:MAG: hypothetical protein ABF646_02265 [Acetobacter papayae]